MGLKKGIPPVPAEEIESLLVRSVPMIKRHAAIVHTSGDYVYSGVYAKSFGYEGILTAGHCANDLLASEHIALIVTDEKHQLVVKPSAFEHVRIGYDEAKGYTANGPDLSFVIIQDKELLQTIKAQNHEFYDLDDYRKRIKGVFTPDMHTINWAVEGSPGEKIEVMKENVDGKEHRITVATSALVNGNFAGYKLCEPFDYVKILVGSGFEEFPASYEGVSGGGIWYQRFVSADGKTYDVEPFLAGIAVWQSGQRVELGYKIRIVEGHGWLSIYGQVGLALAEKRGSRSSG